MFKTLHRSCALILATFILSHLVVHLTALFGPEAHVAALQSVQWVYRNPLGETLLVMAIALQIISGVQQLRAPDGHGWARAQVVSGVYLLVFLVVHTSAALYTHTIHGLETDYYWSAGSLQLSPIKYGFMAYYFGAVLSVFVHLAAALHFGWKGRPPGLVAALPVMGTVVAVAIIAAFSGALYPVALPDAVIAYYEQYFGVLGVAANP